MVIWKGGTAWMHGYGLTYCNPSIRNNSPGTNILKIKQWMIVEKIEATKIKNMLKAERGVLGTNNEEAGPKEPIPQEDEPKPEREIFISYAWGGESESVAKQLDEVFQERGITIIRDKRNLEYKGRIKEFMGKIGSGKCVIVVISKKYLESDNCMFELMQIAKGGKFYSRIFPVVLDDTKIYDPMERIKYVKYWEEKKKALDDEMKSLSSEYLYGFRKDIDLYAEIRQYLPRLTDILRDMNALTVKTHTETGFEELIKAVESKIAE
jgi:hypothetical protein